MIRILVIFILSVLPCTIFASDQLLGYWQNINDDAHYIGFEKQGFVQRTSNLEFRSFVVNNYSDGFISIPNLGPALRNGKKIRYLFEGDALKVARHSFLETTGLPSKGFHTFKRLTVKPPELIFSSLEEGRLELTDTQSSIISNQLIERMNRDQRARRAKFTKADFLAQAEDRRWLNELILKYGWIDIDRFSHEASTSAFLIAQHCIDMRLRKAAEAGLLSDIKKGYSVQYMYAFLADRNLLYETGFQCYGTHYFNDEKGDVVFLPVEEASEIELRRKKIGLSSFQLEISQLERSIGSNRVRLQKSVFE